VTEAPTHPPRLSEPAVFDAAYYAFHCGTSYERSEGWTSFFGSVADRIVADINPATALDAGCAHGFLVEALRDRGVQAYGIDISEFAVSQAREDMRDYVSVGSVLDDWPRSFDLITCIEVLEHMESHDAEAAVANICDHTNDVLFTSTPLDYTEETHINVRPPEHWAELFARHGFMRDIDYDSSYLVPWAVRFRRSREPVPRIVAGYERELWRARHELDERNKVVLSQVRTVDESRARAKELEAERDFYRMSVADRDERVRALESQLGSSIKRMRVLEATIGTPGARTALHLAEAAGRGIRAAAPAHTRRRFLVRRAWRALDILIGQGPAALMQRLRDRGAARDAAEIDDAEYRRWLTIHDPSPEQLDSMRIENARWGYRPLISVIVPVYNPADGWLDKMIASVQAQVYSQWELCLADDHSTSPQVRSELERWASVVPGIKVVFRETNGNISAASNSALQLATGEFVALLDHDDALAPHALHRVVEALQPDREVDLLYSDEDKILLDGRRGEVHLKGDFDPDYLLSTNYICHLLVVRRSLVDDLGGFREGYEGSQDHDLAIRAAERARAIKHVPEVLYNWRKVPGSAALRAEAKPAAWDAGRRAADDALRRRGIKGHVDFGRYAGLYSARYPVPEGTTATLVVLGGSAESVRRSLHIMRQRPGCDISSVVVTGCTSELQAIRGDGITVIVEEGEPRHAHLLNRAARESDGRVIVFLDGDLVPVAGDGGWLMPLVEQAVRPEVAAAGARITAADGSPLHEGLHVGGTAIAESIGVRLPVIQRVAAVSASAMAVDRETFEKSGGFDERYNISLHDVDYCVRQRREGRSIIYTPLTELRHQTSSSRPELGHADAAVFRNRWPDAELDDPYVSPWVQRIRPLALRAEI